MQLYLAYGSNLNKKQIKERCPENKYVDKGELKNYRLYFEKRISGSAESSYLTIKKEDGYKVPYAIYEISKSDEKTLDKKEGVKNKCYTKEYMDIGEYKHVLVYIQAEGKRCEPDKDYYEKCLVGYKDHGLDANILNAAYEYSKNKN